MSLFCFKSPTQKYEYYVLEIQILDDYLRPGSSYEPQKKNTYYTREYSLRLKGPILNENNYYLCYNLETKEFGCKKPNQFFIKIYEFDDKTGLYNEDYPKLKNQLFTLMLENNFIQFVNEKNEETY